MTAARRRLQSPTGTTMWRVVGPNTPPGGGEIFHTESAAKAAVVRRNDKSVAYPVIVECDDTTEEQTA